MTLFLLAIIVHTVLIPIDILFQMIRVDNASYSSNSVVVGMQEGYYVDTELGGYPSPRRPSFHKIMDFLPPQSLIEVKKTEVSMCVCIWTSECFYCNCIVCQLLNIYCIMD